jgi:hypothetical protein
MSDDEAQAAQPSTDTPSAPVDSPLVIPDIKWSEPTGDQSAEIRKGYGVSEVGGTGPIGPPPPPPQPAPSESPEEK